MLFVAALLLRVADPATPNRPQSSPLAATSLRTSWIFPRKSFSFARSSAALMVPAGALALFTRRRELVPRVLPPIRRVPDDRRKYLGVLGALGQRRRRGNGAAASLASYSTSGTSTPSRSMTRAHSRNLESSPSAASVESVRGGGIASRAVRSSPPPPPSAAVSPAMVRACASNAAGDASVRSVSALIPTPATARTRAPHGGPVGGRGGRSSAPSSPS